MMTISRIALSAAASAAALAASAAQAQTASTPQPDTGQTGTAPTTQSSADAAAPDRSDVVVTGTRAPGRSRLDTASPIDVLSGNSLRQQGTTELGTALAAIAPSIDFPRPSATDGTDAIRPATLRGLSPDQTLVLINGTRAHTAALLNLNGSVGRGAAAVDLNTIPVVALDRIEVLRDGASAQYGSDAIAGVINVRLREARSGGAASVTYGAFDTDVATARGRRENIVGEPTTNVAGWQGIGFGKDGYLTLSGEYQFRSATNRADLDPRVNPPAVTGRFGDPRVQQYTGWANAGVGLTEDIKLYGWVGYQYRDTTSAAFPRLGSATTLTAGYPNGFLPFINTRSKDLNSALGIKGTLGDWNFDLNGNYGRNRIDFRTQNSANYTLAAATPKNFYDGALIYDQLVGKLDVSRRFDVFQSLNVAFGLEGRREGFEIKAGELASYTGSGAQGFGGFSALNVINRHRTNGSAYVDLEVQLTPKFLIAAAGRGETYSDFGETATGKVSARYDITPHFALRGTVSNAFRAPALQQQYFTSVASVVVNGTPILTGTFPSTSSTAVALGGKPLQPEKSTNFSAGTVIRVGGLDLTIDGYYIKIRNGLGLSENIQASSGLTAADRAQIAALLTPLNVSAARFFVNGIRTETKGIDAVAHYRARTAAAGTFDLTLAGNVNNIKVTRVPTSTGVINALLFARSRVNTITGGTPGEKITGTVDWSLAPIGATARVTYYGNVVQPGTTPAADIPVGRRAIADLEFRYNTPWRGAELAIGAQNLLDDYPRATAIANNSTGVVGFPFYSPFGFNGRYLYVRAGLHW